MPQIRHIISVTLNLRSAQRPTVHPYIGLSAFGIEILRFIWHFLLLLAIGFTSAGVLLDVRLDPVPDGQATPPKQLIQVIDGDTIEIGDRVVRLFGIQAPELGQRCLHDGVWAHCGLDAAYELKKLIGVTHSPVICSPVAGRGALPAAICMAGRTDIAHVLLLGGYVTTTDEASPAYKEAEAEASHARLGLWHSQFVAPADWRAGERLPSEGDTDADPCPIKAKVTANGKRVFYVPTDADYQTIKTDPAKGDVLFCSVDEALTEGWQHTH
jgi:endonuclease YncB( thermonuclease family)